LRASKRVRLARGKNPIAKIVPFKPPQRERQFGALRGKISVGPEFFRPLPRRELRSWD
jgi:antitoxin (DNA-binding transcriptional repressor) of toxin-antitoxin stability system